MSSAKTTTIRCPGCDQFIDEAFYPQHVESGHKLHVIEIKGVGTEIVIGAKRPIPMLDIEANTRGEIKERMWNEKGPDGGILQLTNGPDGPAVQLWDNLKIVRAVFGNTRLNPIRSGSVETRALSSLVLFDKDGQVLWQAP